MKNKSDVIKLNTKEKTNKKRKILWFSMLALCILAYFVCWIVRLATGNTV